MGPQIVVSAHATVEITKPYKVGTTHAGLEAGVCFRVLNGMKGQINILIQRKAAIRGIKRNLS